MISNTLKSLLAASVLTYVALSATPAEAFTNGLLIPNYICGPATDKLPKTVGAVMTGIINADSGVIAPTFEFLNKTAVAADATVGQQVAQTIATFHNNANDIKPNTNVIHLKFSAKQVTPGKAITIDIFTNNFAPLKNGIQEPTPDGRYALDGAVIYAVDSAGNKIGSFTNMGTKNRFSPVVGCGTTGQAIVHNSLLFQDGDNFTMTANGDPVDTYTGVQWTAPATITGSTVTFMGAAVTDLGFGSHSTVIGVAGVNGAPANPLPAPAGPNPKAFAAFALAAITGNCVLTYPGTDPILSAAGLATPWVTDMNCPQAKVPSFIQANIIDPATGNVFVYHPLVIDADTQPAVAPVAPQLPAGAIVSLHFGTAGTTMVLADDNNGQLLTDANCVFSGGADASPLGGFAHCNALQYYAAVTNNIKKLNPAPRALGTDVNGMACPTSRSFAIVNQAPSYNVPGKYLMTTKDGLFAQSTASNVAALQAANAAFTTVTSSADQALLHTVNKAIGCKTYMAPDLGDNLNLAPSIALDEIQAQLYQAAPVAKVPMNAPAVLLANGNMDGTGAKMVAFRDGVYQTTVTPATAGNGASFCADYANVAVPTIAKWVNTMAGQASLNKDIGVDMPTYLSNRFMRSWIALNCPVLANMDSPITCKDVNGAIATNTPAVLCNSLPNFAIKSITSDPVDNQPDAGTAGAAATANAKSSASTLAAASMTSLVAASLVSVYMQM